MGSVAPTALPSVSEGLNLRSVNRSSVPTPNAAARSERSVWPERPLSGNLFSRDG
jgi:hypothetical protein